MYLYILVEASSLKSYNHDLRLELRNTELDREIHKLSMQNLALQDRSDEMSYTILELGDGMTELRDENEVLKRQKTNTISIVAEQPQFR